MEEFNIFPTENGCFLNSAPLDTGILLKHDYIFIKEVDAPNGISCHEGTLSYTTFGTWGRGDEGDKILKCYTFELFTLSINIHETIQ